MVKVGFCDPCTKQFKKGLITKQTKGTLNLQQICVVNLKLGQITTTVEMYIIKNDLPYVLVGLP